MITHKCLEGNGGKSYGQQFWDLDLLSLDSRHCGDLMETFRIVIGLSGPSPDGFFYKVMDSGTRGHDGTLPKSRSRLLVKSHFFSYIVVNT